MELNINISIRIEQSPALAQLLRALTGGTPPGAPETIKPMIEIDMKEVAKAVEKALKDKPIDLTPVDVNKAVAAVLEEKTEPIVEAPIAEAPATPKRTLAEIKTLATNMAARQDFNTLKFLKDSGYQRMSQIPETEYDMFYDALKKQELF